MGMERDAKAVEDAKNKPDWRDQTGRDRDRDLPAGGSETGATQGASHLPGEGDEPSRSGSEIPREDEGS